MVRMSRVWFCLFGLLGLAAVLLVYRREFGGDVASAAPLADNSAPQREWTPPKAPGGMEKALQQVAPAKFAEPADPEPLVQAEMSLPAKLPALKLNFEGNGTISPTAAETPTPIVDPKSADEVAPPAIVVPDVAAPKEKDVPSIVIPEIVPPSAKEESPIVVPDAVKPKEEEKPTIIIPDIAPPPAVMPEEKKDIAPPPPAEDPKPLPRDVKPEPDTKLPQSPGETTMMGIKTAMSAVLGAAILTAPAPTAQGQEDAVKAVERLEAAVRKLESIERSLTEYKTSNSAAVSQVQQDVEALKSQIRRIEDDVRMLRLSPPSSTSKRDLTNDTTQRMGRIKLVNDYNEAMSVIVNNDSYRLLPGQTRTINMPAGLNTTFTYQVLELQTNPQIREIRPDEEKLIRIYPR